MRACAAFVVTLRGTSSPEARVVITTAPGEEAQVDYGDGPMVRHPETGKYRRTRLFVLTLGYSRKAVRLLVWQSSTQIMRRYERASTLLTSNRPVDDWGKLLGDTAAVTAPLDRRLHHAHVLKCGPRSWRTKVHTICSPGTACGRTHSASIPLSMAGLPCPPREVPKCVTLS